MWLLASHPSPQHASAYRLTRLSTVTQYRVLSERKETELFERFYEGLGSNAAKYAQLIGYTSHHIRDPKTLMPRTMHPLKFKLIMREVDALARTWHS